MNRGQTTLDFGIGAGIFLLVIVFVLTFVPASLQPFDSGIQEETVNADRVVTRLGTSLLTAPGRPYELDTGCTVLFFGGIGPDEYSDCEFSNVPLNEKLGIEDSQPVEVKIVGDVDTVDPANTLCWDAKVPASGEPGRVVEQDNGECDVPFEAGGTPSTDSSVTARRAGSIDGTNAIIQVKMW